jgi:hypothetical protein
MDRWVLQETRRKATGRIEVEGKPCSWRPSLVHLLVCGETRPPLPDQGSGLTLSDKVHLQAESRLQKARSRACLDLAVLGSALVALTLLTLHRTASWSVRTSTMMMAISLTAPSAVGGARCSCVGTTTAAGEPLHPRLHWALPPHPQPGLFCPPCPSCCALSGPSTSIPVSSLGLCGLGLGGPAYWASFQVLLCGVRGSLGGARGCPSSHKGRPLELLHVRTQGHLWSTAATG